MRIVKKYLTQSVNVYQKKNQTIKKLKSIINNSNNNSNISNNNRNNNNNKPRRRSTIGVRRRVGARRWRAAVAGGRWAGVAPGARGVCSDCRTEALGPVE